MKCGKGRFKPSCVGIGHKMHQNKIRIRGPDGKTAEENRGPRT